MKNNISSLNICLSNYLIFNDDIIYDIKDSNLDNSILKEDFIDFFNEHVINLIEKRVLNMQQLDNIYEIIQYLNKKIDQTPNTDRLKIINIWKNIIQKANQYKGFGNVNFYIEQMKIRNIDDLDLKVIITLRKKGIDLDITAFNCLRKNICDSLRNDYIFLMVLLENNETTSIDVRQLFDSKDIETVEQFFASLNAIKLMDGDILKDEIVKDRIKMIIHYIRKNHTIFELGKVLKLIKVYKEEVK